MGTARNRQAGVAMMFVLVAIVVASVLGMTYVTVASVRVAGSANFLRAERARYLAESGTQHGLYLLRAGSTALAGSSQTSPMGPYYADAANDPYRLWAETIAPLDYWVKAQASTGGLTRESHLRVQLSSTYRDRLLALGPVSYWRLGELAGTTAQDQKGANPGEYKNGVLLGQIGAANGDLDRAAWFDGINDYVNVGKFDVSGPLLTILTWFRADDFNVTLARLVSKAKGELESDHFWMMSTVLDSGEMRLRFSLKAGGVTTTVYATSGALKAGEWYMAAATYNGTYMETYLNDVKVAQRFKTGNLNTDDKVSVWIGDNPPTAGSRPFHGRIDEVAIFKKCLSADELAALYQARMASVKIISWDK